MKKLIIGLIILSHSLVAVAHNPLSARYHLEVDADASILTISLSQHGVNQALINDYGAEYFNKLNEKEFKELIVNYIKLNFNVAIDNVKLELADGGIRLGSHQTDLKFVLQPISRDANKLDVAIPAFKENNEHQSIFSYTIYGKKDKVILSNRNDYKAKIYLHVQRAEASWTLTTLIAGIGIATLLMVRIKSLKKVF